MSGWSLMYEEFVPDQEGLREALCTLGNGYFATRGAAPESSAGEVHYPGTYVAGLYNRMVTEVAGRDVENEDLVNVPNWLPLTFRTEGGSWLDLGEVEILDYRQELDLRGGLLTREVRFREGGRTTLLAERRLVSMADPHLAALETTIRAEDWSGRQEVRSALDGTVTNAGVPRYRKLRGDHLAPIAVAEVDEETIALEVETKDSRIRIGQAARTRILRDGDAVPVQRRVEREPGLIVHEMALDLEEGRAVTVEKVVALFTSRDPAIYEPALEARNRVARAPGFDALLERHFLAWDLLWRRFDITFGDEERARMILRLHLFHQLQTISQHSIDRDVGVPARGLHGEAYRGHIFWDELFIFPLLNLRLPELTRSLLMYRHRRLPEARWAARQEGFRGAMYPWQSGSNGREETQVVHLNPRSGRWLPDNSHRQRHINVAIAYNVWQYWQATGDRGFLRYHGAEMLLEIARFFASLATHDRDLDRYVIRGVMGPDEYHEHYPGRDGEGLDNNAYTNVMTAWLLSRALDVFDVLADYHRNELRNLLGITQGELDRWEEISRSLYVPFHDDGIISQFEGYGDLEEFDWEGYRRKYGDIQRLDRILEAEGDTTNRYKLSKQADVLMLFYLLTTEELQDLFERLGYPFDPEKDIRRNIEYYLERTSHGSTLSRVVHSSALVRLDRHRSWELFLEALESDVSDIQGGTTAEGIHLGAMAGTVDLVQRRYGGVSLYGDVLRLDPALPEELSSLVFQVHYREHRVSVDITRERVRLQSRPGPAEPISVGVRGEIVELPAGGSLERPL
jgi:alpha,alpha-trehalase